MSPMKMALQMRTSFITLTPGRQIVRHLPFRERQSDHGQELFQKRPLLGKEGDFGDVVDDVSRRRRRSDFSPFLLRV
jgi:hypothetical protein